MKQFKFWCLIILAGSMFIIISCGDDDGGPAELTLESMSATGTDITSGNSTTADLNGASSASDVPVDAVITATFSRELDASTVSASSVTIGDGSSNVDATVTASGTSVTITPEGELARGTDYTITITGGVAAEDGGVFTSVTRSFKAAGRKEVDPPHADAEVAYWPLNGDAMDAVDGYDGGNSVQITYVADRFGQVESAASFDGDESFIEIPGAADLMDSEDFTASLWIKSDGSDETDEGATRGQFVIGLAGWYGFQVEISQDYGNIKMAAQYALSDETSASQDLWWSTTGDIGWQGWTYDQDVSGAGGLGAILEDKWANLLFTYDASSKVGSIYINGVLRKSQDFNLYGDDHPLYNTVGMAYAGNASPGDALALGFIQGSQERTITDDWANPTGFPDNNHFKGLMDDVRIFHAAFSADEALELYNDEKP